MTTIPHAHDYHSPLVPQEHAKFRPLVPLRQWLNGIEVCDRRFAHLVCSVIPCCCPLERNINLFGRTYHIPALCKLNPFYNELVSLRLRSLTYLAEIGYEDIQKYLC